MFEILIDLQNARYNISKLRNKKVLSFLAWKMWNEEVKRNIGLIKEREF